MTLLPGNSVVAGAVKEWGQLKVVHDAELVERMRVVGVKPVEVQSMRAVLAYHVMAVILSTNS